MLKIRWRNQQPTPRPVGDHEFYKSEFRNGEVWQAAVFTIMRRHAVGFIVSAGKEEDLRTCIDSIQKMKFEAPKDSPAAN